MRTLTVCGMLLGLASAPAMASTYASEDNGYVLYFPASLEPGTVYGYYASGDTSGTVQLERTGGDGLQLIFHGTFEDHGVTNPVPGRRRCRGAMTVVLRHADLPADEFRFHPARAEVDWSYAPTARNCPSAGRHRWAALVESLPAPAADGDFDDATAFLSETNGLATWPAWEVVDPDPAGLNCRATPDGRIVRALARGTRLAADTRHGNAIVAGRRGPWLKVRLDDRRSCHVRASEAYIRPLSEPENHL
jgi:hypothetical protein